MCHQYHGCRKKNHTHGSYRKNDPACRWMHTTRADVAEWVADGVVGLEMGELVGISFGLSVGSFVGTSVGLGIGRLVGKSAGLGNG
jgi:hypothetical protein